MMAAALAVGAQARSADLFEQIGQFLARHGLSADPAHYAFAHAVVTASDPVLAEAVEQLTDGGIRLSGSDIVRLGGTVVEGPPVAMNDDAGDRAATLVARTQMQVEGFAGLVEAVHAEAMGFGRDLEARVAAMPIGGDLARITGMMIERIHQSELRLAAATRETQTLRAELEEAIGCARRDPLTGLANRRGFEDALATLAPDAPYAIAICDIDHFKRVNDAYGHEVGDRVLVAIGKALAEACAPHIVARHGGEEFTILFADTLLGDARAVLRRACGAIGTKNYRVRGSDARLGAITLSAGIASACLGEMPIDALARADAALFAAKNAGRNRLHIAP